MIKLTRGFTLIEVLIAVLIIGILGAIALPQYQRAVLKSRFAALMPIAKSMADSNEAFYLEHGEYADNAEDLPVQGRRNYSDGTELEFGTTSEYSYVLATRDNDFPNKYIVYQKHSEQFPGEIHCEAAADNTQAQEVCKSFGATEDIGETLTPNYLTYVLFGTGNGVAPEPPCDGVTCDSAGNITECPSGKTLNNGECITCDIENAATCSTTSYAAASCNEGYVLNAGACEVDPTPAKLQAVVNTKCPEGDTRYVCTIKNGAVYRCNINNGGKIDEATGECVSNGISTGGYEYIYDADGDLIGYYGCGSVYSGHCYSANSKIPTDDGGFKLVQRTCSASGAITKEGVCSNGYLGGIDELEDSHGHSTFSASCHYATISTTTGECRHYRSIFAWDYSYSTNGKVSVISKQCTTVSANNPSATCSNYQPLHSRQWNETGTAFKDVQCYNDGNSGTSLNDDGTCPSGTTLKSYDSATGQYTSCSSLASVNWETATCS